MASLPKCFATCEYRNAWGARVEASKMTRESGQRIIMVDGTSHYRMGMRSAVVWRPPRDKDTAVLCLRNGMAMAVASKDDVWLTPVGGVAPDTPEYKHMGAYACRYVPEHGTWKIIEQAKRKESLSDQCQVMEIIDGTRKVTDGHDIFPPNPLSNSVKK